MNSKLFSELGLSPELLKAVDHLGFELASPIQAAAIPVLLAGTDVVGQSQTGSGKTAAFGLPAIEKVDPQQRAVQVLVLCPTRELAVQVSEDLHRLAQFKRGVHPLPIYGGQSYERQFQGLRQGAQIVIGTPGRVMDHMRRGTLRLDRVVMVILDEADVMLDMGFRDDIELILQDAPKERQTVFFSATLPRPIQDLIQRYSRDPQTVRIEQKELTVPTVEQTYYEVDRRFKVELLTRLIDLHDLRLGIIFCNTKRMVDDLVEHLNAQGYSADRLHGDMSQAMRDRVMNRFRKSGLEFLVATDVAARGLDIDDLEVVFNYDLPYDAEDYLHRIGRTGRAGRSGIAISFASGKEVFQIRQIERFTKVKIQRGKPPTVQEVEEARADVFLDQVRATLKGGEFAASEGLVGRLLEEGFSSTDVASALLHMLKGPQRAVQSREQGERAPAQGAKGIQKEPARGDGRQHRDDHHRTHREETSQRQEKREYPAKPKQSKVQMPAGISPSNPESARPKTESIRTETPKPPQGTTLQSSPPTLFLKKREPKPSRPPEPNQSRRTPDGQARLFMSIGSTMGITAADILSAIQGQTGLPLSAIGTVDVRERHAFVDVAEEHARSIISKLNRADIKGKRVKIKEA